AQPATVATTVMPTTSVAATSNSCELLAPAQVRRCRRSRWSRRSRVEASSAKPSRRTAASPPRIRRRSPATRLVARIDEIVRGGGATEPQRLAVGGRAAARHAAAAQIEPARQPVDGAEVHERAAPRRLAEHGHAERRLAEDRLHRATRDPVELEEREARLPG